ncbi:sulfatase-like hydrolase/transferase [Permianibacter sp. IMCC34836]|uniref:sulfatase-like hydrolase/transferase n=1 Tax=Permianibacter fluminis TaxID=2738515 RepID=UPI001557D03F|nr:sulfatase-like hydrolase/transferase [Permianibacter fluminis]NQD35573.1 sulfatase-like hydrolase/transferase [Permianibacter fluminis]
MSKLVSFLRQLLQAGVPLRAALLTVLVEAILLADMLPDSAGANPTTVAFSVMALLAYASMYLAVALLPAWLLNRFKLPRAAAVWFWLLAGIVFVLTLIDSRLYPIYGFHLNGFVLNLVLTPGGIDSLGGDAMSFISMSAQVTALLLLPLLLLWLAARRISQRWLNARVCRYGVIVLIVALLGERIIYGIADLRGPGTVLTVANSFPMYDKTYFRSFGKRIGLAQRPNVKVDGPSVSGRLHYPQRPLQVTVPAQRYNVIWLVAESLRADMLDPDIMPATWHAAQRGRQFRQHFSGGNGTRMGMFSLFYGLPGNYWFSFLGEHRSAAVIDVLQQQHYEMQLFTAQSFTYPEFDRTIFANIDSNRLHVDDKGEGWERDRRNSQRLIEQLQQRHAEQPLFLFNFFESTHARYTFPDDAAIRPDYLREFNYARMDVDSFKRDINGIRDRYVNSARALDQALAPLWAYMEQEKLFDNTVVVFTGDHGEEFMDSGRWGHNSAFVPAQLHVPLVLWLPGESAAVDDRLSAHMDVVATLMPRLGVQNPVSDYSLGFDLLAAPARQQVLVSDWDRVGYLDADYILTLPLSTDAGFRPQVTDGRGQAVSDEAADAALLSRQRAMQQVMHDISRFYRAPDETPVLH